MNMLYGYSRYSMAEACEFTKESMKKAAQRQKKGYDQTVKTLDFQPSKWVWYWYPPGVRKKLGLGRQSPYLVTCKISGIAREI